MLIFKRRDLNSADELTQLADLRDRGVITDDEFQKGKAPIAGLTHGSCSTKQESARRSSGLYSTLWPACTDMLMPAKFRSASAGNACAMRIS
jgi:hypothetical protein